MISEIPCKNCITLSICKALSNEHLKNNKHKYKTPNSLAETYYLYNEVLKPKCDIIYVWIGEYHNTEKTRYDRLNAIRKLFINNL